jgi:hypothetical protein
MRSFVRALPAKLDRPLFAILIFVVVWFVGTAALTGGLEGIGERGPAICVFAVACAAWWGMRRFGGPKSESVNTAAFVVTGLWMLKILIALLVDFHHCIADVFFWASVSMVLLLTMAAALTAR